MYPQKLVSYKCLECDSEHFAQGNDTVLCLGLPTPLPAFGTKVKE